MTDANLKTHPVVSRAAWLAARSDHLAKEKAFTRLRDELSRERRELPWERVEKKYVFEGPSGQETLSDLFAGRSQLIIYHFMFDPDWEEGCKSCSWWADNFDRNAMHLKHRDVTLIAVSKAPYSKLADFKRRMGWSFKWVSSFGTDFNFDFHVSFTPEEMEKEEAYYNYRITKAFDSEMPGISVFYKNPDGEVFHTYSCYSRGLDMMNAGYHYLDLVPKGRDEADQKPYTQAWVRHRDRYTD
jgi:predicted dithiol-disulfide oxidoreductase (DUF899 family)